MEMVTIEKKEYDRLKSLEKDIDYLSSAKRSAKDAESNRIHQVT